MRLASPWAAYQIFDSFHSTTLVHPLPVSSQKLLLQLPLGGSLRPYVSLSGSSGVLVLVALNGFFAAVEFSLVAVRLSRVRQLVAKGSSQAKDR